VPEWAEIGHQKRQFVEYSCSVFFKSLRATFRDQPPVTWLVFASALVASMPAWIVRHPPLQDMPFHLATLRVIHDFATQGFNFARDYELNLAHTSYLFYYLAGSALAYVLGVYRANVVMMSICLGALPLALRAFLKAVRRDERLALFSVPLGVNVMFIYGLLPYVLGLPVMFFALAAVVTHFRTPTRNGGIAVAVWSAILFFTHIFPFGLFALGALAYFPYRHFSKWRPAVLSMVPSVLLLGWWLKGSAAGKQAGGSLNEAFAAPRLGESMQSFFQWSTNVFQDDTDEKWFLLLVLVAIVSGILSVGERALVQAHVKPFALVLLCSAACFFLLGDHLGDVWLFAQRFPVPFLLSVIPFLSIPRGTAGTVMTTLLVFVGAGSTWNVCEHFIRFEQTEVGALDEAIEHIPEGKRVCGLIYDKGSSLVHHSPFLHYVSYVQAERGGVTMFGYAHFLHWPFRFKPGMLPPPGTPARPRWEWTPEQVPIAEVYPYYDYVLTRGAGFAPPAANYKKSWQSDRWAVWERVATP
jgi:hypothetical protein